jgi:hypothetical protein
LYRAGIRENPQQATQHPPLGEQAIEHLALDEQEVHSPEPEHPDVVVADYLLNQYGTMPTNFPMDADEPKESSFIEKEAATPLYKGCKLNRLAFILMWQKLCARHALTHVAQDDILGLFGYHVLDPKLDPKMPLTRFEVRNVITNVGLDYITIDACPCDEVLYFHDNENKTFCPKCRKSRYREDLKSKKVPRKV